MRKITNPRIEVIAFQIWHVIQKTGGECYLDCFAELTGESKSRCASIAHKRGWTRRYRGGPRPVQDDTPLILETDTMMGAGA